MEAKKFAIEQLKRGKKPSEVKYEIAERGISYREADMIVSEAVSEMRPKTKPARKQQSQGSEMTGKLAFVILVVVFIIATSFILYTLISNPSQQTGKGNMGSPDLNPPVIFSVDSKEASGNQTISVRFTLSRKADSAGKDTDYIYVFTDLDNSSFSAEADNVMHPSERTYIFDVAGTNRVGFNLTGIYNGDPGLSSGGKPMVFSEYHVIVLESLKFRDYNVFGWT